MIGSECRCFALHNPFLLLRKQAIDGERKLLVCAHKISFFAVFLPINFPAFYLLSQIKPSVKTLPLKSQNIVFTKKNFVLNANSFIHGFNE